MTIEITDLRYFVEVAEQGSFSRAAGIMRLAQPSVSERMAGLERSVGAALFERSTRGAALTAAGWALVPYARRCLALAEEGRQAARSARGSERIVIVTPPSLAPVYLPRMIEAMGDAFEVLSRTGHSHEVIEQLADARAHLGLLLGSAVPAGISVRPLGRVPIVVVAHAKHPLAGGNRRLRPQDLLEHRLAVHTWSGQAAELEELLRASDHSPPTVCWVSPAATAIELALSGYVAVVPADVASRHLVSGSLRRLRVAGLPRWEIDVELAWRDTFSGAHRDLIERLTLLGRSIARNHTR